MSDRVFVKEELVPVDDVPMNPIRCPRCKGQTLTMYGNLQRTYVETLENGQKVDSKLGEDVLVHEIEILECHVCSIRFQIQTRENWELQKRILELEARVQTLTGVGKPC